MRVEELEELRRLEAKAAAGPWRTERFGNEHEDAVTRVITPDLVFQNAAICADDTDGRFIAAARNALPRLLAERESLLDAVRSERARIAAGADVECKCSVCEQLKESIASAER